MILEELSCNLQKKKNEIEPLDPLKSSEKGTPASLMTSHDVAIFSEP